MTDNKEFQKNINGLRALAVTSVTFFHFKLFSLNSGFVGVDIFFVISGYLMTKILLSSNGGTLFELYNFYTGRIRRIVPSLAFITIIVVALFSTNLLQVDFDKVLRRVIASNLFFSNYSYYLIQGGYFASAAVNNPLLHTWSLSLEWQFYIAYPIIVLLLKNNSNEKIIKICLISIFFASLFFCLRETSINPSYAYYSLESRAWEFIAGGMVAIIHLKNCKNTYNPLPLIIQIIIASGLIASLVLLSEYNFPGWKAITPVAITSLIIYDKNQNGLNKILSLKPMQYIGNISYSLYLWHWIVLSYISLVVVVDRELTIYEKTFGIILSIALSHLTYKHIEAKTRNKNGFWSIKKIIYLWIVSILIPLSLLTFLLKSEASKYRLPEYLQRVELGMKDKNPNSKKCMSSHEELVDNGHVPKFCKFGDEKSITTSVLLWGDSHADAMQPAIDFALKKENLGGVASTASGCAPFDGVGYVSDESKASFYYCGLGQGKNTIEFIHKTDSIKYVIMHANWARYDFNILRSELVPQVCEIKKTGKKIILIGQVPSPNFDVPRVWANRQLKIGHKLDEITFDESISNKVYESFKGLVLDIESSCGKVQVIYPSVGLCESGKCYAVKNGKLNYIDANHLSTNGAANFQEIILKNLPIK